MHGSGQDVARATYGNPGRLGLPKLGARGPGSCRRTWPTLCLSQAHFSKFQSSTNGLSEAGHRLLPPLDVSRLYTARADNQLLERTGSSKIEKHIDLLRQRKIAKESWRTFPRMAEGNIWQLPQHGENVAWSEETPAISGMAHVEDAQEDCKAKSGDDGDMLGKEAAERCGPMKC